MDIERTLETQRHRLLRIVAGLVLVVGVLAVGPISRWFSKQTLEFVGPVLSRVEATVRYLVITQAFLMIDHCGLDVERRQISVSLTPEWDLNAADMSLSECRRRLRILRAVLMDLPRHALRLLRRIAKQNRRTSEHAPVCFDLCRSAGVHGWRQAAPRIERPPDKAGFATLFFLPPSGSPVGGVGG